MNSQIMKKIVFVLCLGLALFTNQAFSQKSTSPLTAKFLIESGIEYGGDEILQVFLPMGENKTCVQARVDLLHLVANYNLLT